MNYQAGDIVELITPVRTRVGLCQVLLHFFDIYGKLMQTSASIAGYNLTTPTGLDMQLFTMNAKADFCESEESNLREVLIMTAHQEQIQEIPQDIREDDLPSSMQFISSLIGLEATLKLLQVYGGRSVYIPQKVRDNHPIVRVAGRSALEKLSAEFGGLALQFPMAACARSKVRNRVIRAQRTASSASGSKLARDFKLSQRQIWKILGKPDAL